MDPPKKIVIFGIPGSGKSTFALQLSDALKLPLYHLDRFFFVENWEERNREEFLRIQQKIVDLDVWIIDGNSVQSLEMRYCKADLVLYFRLNRLLCFYRIFKRFFSKDPRISDRADGCPERVSIDLIRYLWGFPKEKKPLIENLKARYPQVVFHEIRSGCEAKKLFHSLTGDGSKV